HHLPFTICSLLLLMLCGVEAQDFLALTGARVNGAQVFAPLHLPDGCDLPVLLDGVICNLFGLRLLRCARRVRRFAACVRTSLRRVLVLCHNVPLSTLI